MNGRLFLDENLGLSLGHSRGRPKRNRTKSLCLCAFFLPETKPHFHCTKPF